MQNVLRLHSFEQVFVLQRFKRDEVLYSLSPASSRCATLACSHRMRSWPRGGTPRQALAHSKFSLHSTSTVMVMYCPDTHSVFTAPPGAILSTTQVGTRVGSCHSSLNLDQCARGWSSCTRIQGLMHRSSSRASSTSPTFGL